MPSSDFPWYSGLTKEQIELRRLEIENSKREFFAEARDGFYISTREGQFLDCNRALVRMLGYESIAEVLSLDLNCELWAHAEDRPQFQETIEHLGYVRDYQGAFKHKSGRLVHISLSSHVWLDENGTVRGYRGFVVDRTPEKLLHDRLTALETRYRDLFKNLRDGVFVSDDVGTIIDCNPAFCDIIGYSRDEFLSMDYYRHLFVDKTAIVDFRRQFTRYGSIQDYELQIIRKDGSIRDVSLSGYASRSIEGHVMSYQGMMRDITEAKRLKNRLVESEKLSAMGRMASHLAHELNNPLYGIMNCVDLVRSSLPENYDQRKYLDLAFDECQRTSGLLIKMLKFCKPDNEQKCLINLNTLLEETLLFYVRQFKNQNIRVVTDFDDQLPMFIAIPNQLKQVFINMIVNANAAMTSGGELRVFSRYDAPGNQIIISIEDTGVGIPKENLERIFEAFFTTRKEVKGVGLGLSLCHGIVSNHNGRIEVESKVGSGTVFKIYFPCNQNGVADRTDI